MNLEEKVQSLLAAANAATGEADTNLTDAVGTLIAGQGSGSAQIPFTTSETVVIGANDISKNHEIIDYFYPEAQTALNQLIIIEHESATNLVAYQMIAMHHFHATATGNYVSGVNDYMLIWSEAQRMPFATAKASGNNAFIPESSKYIVYTFGRVATT